MVERRKSKMKKSDEAATFLGLTLAEARKIHPVIRIQRVGEQVYIGTRDLKEDRLNVTLSEIGLTFDMVPVKPGVTTKAYSDKELEKAIIVSAHFG